MTAGALVVRSLYDHCAQLDGVHSTSGWRGEADPMKPIFAIASLVLPLGTPSRDVHLTFCLPKAEMNVNGPSVAWALGRIHRRKGRPYRVVAPELLETLPIIVHDDLELPLGQVKRKWAGSAGGHNGIRSVEETFGKLKIDQDFWRLRLGIGRPASREADVVSAYVLGRFPPEELDFVRHQLVLQTWSELTDLVAHLDRADADAKAAAAT